MTSDEAILNNVYLYSQQDTILAGSQGCNATTCSSAREYMWKGLISGNVDYVFGDAALVFDHTTFFTTYHGSPTGTETIEAQNKHFPTGSTGDYLSGYICNGCRLLSQAPAMSSLFYGRPYGPYSTWIMLDSAVDQVAPVGWIEFSVASNLPTSTYGEYNTMAYTDPAVGTAPYPSMINAVTPVGGNTGAGATSFSSRETTSASPGTLQATNLNPRLLTAAQAAQYYPINFLSTPLAAANLPSGQPVTWNPVTDLATRINAFVPATPIAGQTPGTSITILERPQTPGAGVIPTGNYAFYDSLGTNQICIVAIGNCTLLAIGTLDSSGEAYLTTGSATGNALTAGTHYLTFTYGGDANFAASTSVTYAVPVIPQAVNTFALLSVATTSSTYGGTISGTVKVTAGSGTAAPNGTVELMSGSTGIGGCTLVTKSTLAGGCSFSLAGVAAGLQTMSAVYASTGGSGSTTFGASTSAGVSFSVAPAVLQVIANNYSVAFSSTGTTIPAFTYTTSGYVNSDASAVLSGAPALTTNATSSSPVGEYPIVASTGTLQAANYSFVFSNGYLGIAQTSQAAAVATGVTVPSSGVMNCAGATDKYGDGCQATSIALPAGTDLRGLAADPFGGVYYTETAAGVIRKIAPNGTIVNFAGFVSGTACPAPAATSALNSSCVPTTVSLNKPCGVSSDAAGNIFIADYSGGRVYEVKVSDGLMYTLAGTGLGGSAGDEGPAISATLDAPRSAWGDPLGNVYIADTTNNKIRVVDANGDIHTFVGTGTGSSTGDGGPAISATISNPQGVIVDQNLNVYVADGGGNIHVVCVSCGTGSPLDSLLAKVGITSPVNGYIYTVAGNGTTTAFAYSAPVRSTSISMAPQKLGMDAVGNL